MMPFILKTVALTALCLLAPLQSAHGDQFFVKQKIRLIPIVGAEKHFPIVEQRGKRKMVRGTEIVTKTGRSPSASGHSIVLETIKVRSRKNPSSKLSVELKLRTEETIEAEADHLVQSAR